MSGSTKNLDNDYGICIDPVNVGIFERDFKNFSWFVFNESGSDKFKKIIEIVKSDFYVSHCLFSDFTVLWLVDREGKILIALEEIVADKDTDRRYPLAREVPRENPIRKRRLGHPALVGGQAARIGGELSYEPQTKTWYLSNRSGRFGINVGRTEQQLEQVAKEFRARGFQVTVEFVGHSGS